MDKEEFHSHGSNKLGNLGEFSFLLRQPSGGVKIAVKNIRSHINLLVVSSKKSPHAYNTD